MPAAALPPEDRDELADLQRRAYGPGADIDADAAARLAHLEEAARAASVPRPDAPPLPPPVVAAASEPPHRAESAPVRTRPAVPGEGSRRDALDDLGLGASAEAEVGDDDAGPAAAPDAARRRIPRSALVLAAATVFVAVLAASVVWVATTLAGGGADRVLARVEGADGEEELIDRELFEFVGAVSGSTVVYEPFETLVVWSAEIEGRGTCLVVGVSPQHAYGMSCTPAELTPIVDVQLAPTGGEPSIEGYAPGTIVRFELHGDQVRVRVAQNTPLA